MGQEGLAQLLLNGSRCPLHLIGISDIGQHDRLAAFRLNLLLRSSQPLHVPRQQSNMRAMTREFPHGPAPHSGVHFAALCLGSGSLLALGRRGKLSTTTGLHHNLACSLLNRHAGALDLLSLILRTRSFATPGKATFLRTPQEAIMAPQLSCPICHRTTIKPLFEDFGISIDVYGKLRKVGGLSTFMCTVENHIFFVRTSDLAPEDTLEVSA